MSFTFSHSSNFFALTHLNFLCLTLHLKHTLLLSTLTLRSFHFHFLLTSNTLFLFFLYRRRFLFLSTFSTHLFLLPYSDTQWLSHFYTLIIFQLRILSYFQTTLIPLSLYTHATVIFCSSHFYLTLTSHTHTTLVLISHYTHFTFTLQSLFSYIASFAFTLFSH